MIDHTGSWSDSDNYSPISSTSDSRSGRIRSRSVGHISQPHKFCYENQYSGFCNSYTLPLEHMYSHGSQNIPEHKIIYQMYPSPNKVPFLQASSGQEFSPNSLPSSPISNTGEHFYVQRELKRRVPRSRRKSINLPIVKNYKSLNDLKKSYNQIANSNSNTTSSQALKAFNETQTSLLHRIIDDLKTDKLNLKKQVSLFKTEMIKLKMEANNEMEGISTEVEKLKHNLKNRHNDVVKQWADTLEELSGRINELGTSSTNINNAVAAMEQKLNILETETMKEMDVLQKRYNEEVKITKTINEKFKSEKALEESKIESLKVEFESIVKSKEAEIEKLKKSIREQCFDMQQDIEEMQKEILIKNNKVPVEVIMDSNVKKLQKYISKLEKDKAKSVRNYEKKIALLVKEIELQEKSKVIQLKMHRTQVLLEVSTKHQMETSKVASELEQRYKRLLDEQRTLADFRHTHDMKIIDELRRNIIDLTNI